MHRTGRISSFIGQKEEVQPSDKHKKQFVNQTDAHPINANRTPILVYNEIVEVSGQLSRAACPRLLGIVQIGDLQELLHEGHAAHRSPTSLNRRSPISANIEPH